MLGQLVAAVAGLAPAGLLLALLRGGHGEGHGVGSAGRGTRPADLTPWPTAALLIGSLAGFAFALLRNLSIVRERELVTLTTLIPLGLAELVLVAACWTGLGRTPLARGAATALAALLAFRVWPGVWLDLFGDLAGVTSVWSSDGLAVVAGFGLGAALVVLAAVLVSRFPTGRVLVTAALAIVFLSHLVTIVQVLHARALIKLPLGVFRALVWAVNHQGLVLLALLAMSALAVAQTLRPAQGPSTVSGSAGRLARATVRRQRRLGLATLAALGALLLAVTLGAWWADRQPELSPPEPFDIVGVQAVIPLAAVDDGHLHRFAYETADGVTVRFIVVKKGGGAYGVGLDACEICGATGYLERAGQIICRLCDVVMNIATIGFRGGCNPIPLDFTVASGALHIDLADLEAAAPTFA
jgi:hypothetical protein